MDQQNLEENIIVEDNALATKIAVDSSAVCQNFTDKAMLNPSPSYPFANNPGVYACSSPLMKAAVPNPTPVISCSFAPNQSSCPFYLADYSIVLKSSLVVFNQTSTFYLTRFKSFDGSYFYKIYDSTGTVFFNLNYVNISNSDGKVDEEAKLVFHNFLNQFSEDQNVFVHDFHADSKLQNTEQKTTNSYLNSLIS